jgi:nitrate reductase gamma subunit
MAAAHWFLAGGLAVFFLVSVGMLWKTIPAWRMYDPTAPKGKPALGALYSLTGAMMPWKKESARLYPASYILGVLFHLGSFLGFVWVAVLFFGAGLPAVLVSASALFLGLTATCGFGLLIKRITSPNLRYFSSPDDYFSNMLVTGWQVLIIGALRYEIMLPALLVLTGVLLLYMPIGKLRHAVYFVPARVYLGLFYGRRGVWPARGRRS